MKKEYDVVIERDGAGYFGASVPALPGCHTQAKSLDKLSERIQEAIALCLEEYGASDEVVEFVGIQRVAVDSRVPGHLDLLDGISSKRCGHMALRYRE